MIQNKKNKKESRHLERNLGTLSPAKHFGFLNERAAAAAAAGGV